MDMEGIMKEKVLKIGITAVAFIILLVGVILAVTCGEGKDKSKKDSEETSTYMNSGEKVSGENETDDKSEDEETQSSAENGSGEETQSSGENGSDEETQSSSNQADGDSATTIPSESETTNGTHIKDTTSKETTTDETTTKEPATEEPATKDTSVVPDDSQVQDGIMRNMTTAQIVKDMGIGINLGNTFESCGDWINDSSVTNFETAWGSPQITKAMIQGIAAEGFGVLRIPVAWSNMMSADYTIATEYIDRVKEVATWAIDSGMYVIVNIHYDGGWWTDFPTDKANCMAKYKAIWTQLSLEFKDYGDKLIFESLNEEGCWDSVWNRYGSSTKGKQEAYGLLNEINQTFVDIVRASGGNNTYRHLLIAGYATDIDATCDSCYKMPEDAQGRCAVSVHYYTPFAYTHLEKDESWATVQTEWGSDADTAELNKYMKKMYDDYVSKGIPVIIGEFGVPTMSNKSKDNAIFYIESVAKAAYDYGMCPVLWDTTNSYSYYNRYTCSMSEYAELKEAFANILK